MGRRHQRLTAQSPVEPPNATDPKVAIAKVYDVNLESNQLSATGVTRLVQILLVQQTVEEFRASNQVFGCAIFIL